MMHLEFILRHLLFMHVCAWMRNAWVPPRPTWGRNHIRPGRLQADWGRTYVKSTKPIVHSLNKSDTASFFFRFYILYNTILLISLVENYFPSIPIHRYLYFYISIILGLCVYVAWLWGVQYFQNGKLKIIPLELELIIYLLLVFEVKKKFDTSSLEWFCILNLVNFR